MKRKIIIWSTLVFGVATFIYFLSPDRPITVAKPSPRAATRPTLPRATPVSTAPTSSSTSSIPTISAAPATAPDLSITSYTQLANLLQEKSERINRLIFVEGTLDVRIRHDKSLENTIKAPTVGALDELRKAAQAKGVAIEGSQGPVKGTGIGSVIISLLPMILILLVIVWFMRSQTRRTSSKTGLTGRPITPKKFKDIAGQESAVRSLRQFVRFEKQGNASVFQAFGAERPSGVIFVGPPGTGKTLLAQVIAGEADMDVTAISGSDFVEMFVGVGAARVRSLLSSLKAKYKQTGRRQILFIDEIDAVGGHRGGAGTGGAHPEREQTLNALLVELDGVEKDSGVIPFAATNRLDMLDPALTRPGRFDYVITVDLPDLEGRMGIIKIHASGKPVDPALLDEKNGGLRDLAARFTGASGAYLRSVLNTAALQAAERTIAEMEAEAPVPLVSEEVVPEEVVPEVMAAQASPVVSEKAPRGVKAKLAALRERLHAAEQADRGVVKIPVYKRKPHQVITLADIEAARSFIEFGDPKMSLQRGMTDVQKDNTGVHEVGHAWMSELYPWGYSVSAVDLVPRAKYLGVTLYDPVGEQTGMSDVQVRNRIMTLMAGRVAQEVLLNTVDSGASNDFQQSTNVARKMVAEWGMSPLGHFYVSATASSLGRERGQSVSDCGGKLADAIDDQWRAIIEECYKETRRVIERDKESIRAIADVLFKEETFLAPRWKELVKQHPPKADNEKAARNEEVQS